MSSVQSEGVNALLILCEGHIIANFTVYMPWHRILPPALQASRPPAQLPYPLPLHARTCARMGPGARVHVWAHALSLSHSAAGCLSQKGFRV